MDAITMTYGEMMDEIENLESIIPKIDDAIARGHEVTLFNRGKTNTHLFPDLEKLKGDRNDDITALEEQVAVGRRWDAVVDNTASIAERCNRAKVVEHEGSVEPRQIGEDAGQKQQ